VARELPRVSLEDALLLVRLYGVKESPKYERAAVRWIRRYLNEAEPALREVAKIVVDLERRTPSPHSQ
jgi:hypothetical protein